MPFEPCTRLYRKSFTSGSRTRRAFEFHRFDHTVTSCVYPAGHAAQVGVLAASLAGPDKEGVGRSGFGRHVHHGPNGGLRGEALHAAYHRSIFPGSRCTLSSCRVCCAPVRSLTEELQARSGTVVSRFPLFREPSVNRGRTPGMCCLNYNTLPPLQTAGF